ncbi:nitrous oxide reductase accessory protein NosL [Pseudomonas sp. R151218B TE3479]
MNRVSFKAGRLLAGLLMCLALAACDKAEPLAASEAVPAFHPGDECHVCGMVITDFPGPKGAAVGAGGVKKFCSTAEMLGWWLQPETIGLTSSCMSMTWAAVIGTRRMTPT